MSQPSTIDSLRTRIATITAQQQAAAVEAQRSETVLKEAGWDPTVETVEQFVQRKQSEARALEDAAAAKLAELDVLVSAYEGGAT